MIVNALCIFPRNLERLGNEIRDVFSDQQIRIEMFVVNLLRVIWNSVRCTQYQFELLTGSERHHACPQILRVERDVDTRERDGGETALEGDVAFLRLQLLRLSEAGVDNLAEHLLDLVDGELLGQLQIRSA